MWESTDFDTMRSRAETADGIRSLRLEGTCVSLTWDENRNHPRCAAAHRESEHTIYLWSCMGSLMEFKFLYFSHYGKEGDCTEGCRACRAGAYHQILTYLPR